MDLDKLISTVEKYTIIYDSKRSDFKDTRKKNNAWKSIANELKCTVEEAKANWKSLREKFVREKKKYTPSGSGAAEEDVSEFYKSLLFLEKFIRPRKTHTNIIVNDQLNDANPKPQETQENKQTKQNESEELDVVETLDLIVDQSDILNVDEFMESHSEDYVVLTEASHDESTENISPPSPLPSTSSENKENQKSQINTNTTKYKSRLQLQELPKKRNKLEDLETSIGDAIKCVSEVLKTQSASSAAIPSEDNSSDSAFAKYVGSCLKEMTKEEKNRKKAEIMKILLLD